MKNMNKAQLITELHNRGEWWANESYSKQYLQNYLEQSNKASSMSMEELLAHIQGKMRHEQTNKIL